ncbi:zonular occludens toxin domain-containing protein [Adlercreutzia mucosicola]|uniref:zonular occludens toxin domain-containing protein n=1 Tax=Adlercreutzia mucosicola TaxID=580026 RepID=UPI0005514C11|nr:zonular occludens toxin domain-containing protein [Adlercreutzia mucosicola]MCR2036158.1 zonular occludens toxin domain-containing protein [Adlercreutzia mucosicola]
MIYLYSGTPGSGKSLHVARDIRDHLGAKGLPVIANFDINPSARGYEERFTWMPNDRLSPDWLVEFASSYWEGRRVREDSILLVVDEAQLVFNSRAWQQGERMEWIEFFSQHRHFGYKVVLIAQFDRMIDRQIRCLIEIEVSHRRLGNFGLKGLLLSLPFRGRLFLAVSYYYGLRERVGSSWILPRRAYFRLYDSYSRFRQVGAAS